MPDIKTKYNNEKGFVLPVGLIFLIILALLGTTAVIITTTDLNIGGKYKQSEQSFYAAEAGIEEARARLKKSTASDYAGDPSTGYDPWWSAYILTSDSWQTSDDTDYNANYKNYIPTSASHTNTTITTNSLQSNILYFVKIRHKREYDAEQAGHTISSPHYYDGDGNTGTNTASAPGNIIYYGYENPANPTTAEQCTTSGTTEYKPVEIITGYGQTANSLKRIEIEVKQDRPLITSALYAKGDVTGNGSSLSIDGNDNCGVASPKKSIYTLSPFTTTLNGHPTLNPTGPQQGTNDIDILDIINKLKELNTVVITNDETNVLYGNTNNFVTCYSDTSDPYNVNGLTLSGVTGFGNLIVEGDLILGGGFQWNGVILVTGTLTFNGGGSGINIRGAILTNSMIGINGGIDIRYDSCMVDNALDNRPLDIISWKESY